MAVHVGVSVKERWTMCAGSGCQLSLNSSDQVAIVSFGSPYQVNSLSTTQGRLLDFLQSDSVHGTWKRPRVAIRKETTHRNSPVKHVLLFITPTSALIMSLIQRLYAFAAEKLFESNSFIMNQLLWRYSRETFWRQTIQYEILQHHFRLVERLTSLGDFQNILDVASFSFISQASVIVQIWKHRNTLESEEI